MRRCAALSGAERSRYGSGLSPHFDRNPNAGVPFGRSAELQTATRRVLHDPHPSQLVLQVERARSVGRRAAGPADSVCCATLEHMASPTVAPDVKRPPVSEPAPAGGPDAPVRIEVAMPRGLFDRLTGRDDAPRCRYDEHTGLAEFVAEPGVAHEGPAWAIGDLVSCVRYVLADHGHHVGWRATGALRLLSDDGAFEADASFYLDPTAERALRDRGIAGYVDVRAGLPPPDLVVEIDRSRRSRHKLAPYFRMGVKEAWTSDRKEGASIWTPDAGAPEGFRWVPASAVLPGLTAADLAALCARGDPLEQARHSRRVARRVAARILAAPPG